MKIYLNKGGLSVVRKSGVGSAVRHQEQMLSETGAPVTEHWKEATAVHINTVFPDSFLAAYLAKKQGKKVIYYGYSTMEDFRNSFIGSNRMAPLFKKWICRCYEMGDVITDSHGIFEAAAGGIWNPKAHLFHHKRSGYGILSGR